MPLRYLVVGTGRDGTVSLTQIVNDIFKLNGIPAVAAHEYLARECHESYSLYKETGDDEHLTRLRQLIRDCPYEAIVGNGYASLLPLFREAFPDVALIHLKRKDREATIQSHKKNSKLFPDLYAYYAATGEGVFKRVAAFHEGEMSRDDWEALSLHDRFGWFYDYTHRTIEQERSHFSRCFTISTESLSERETLNALAHFIVQGAAASPKAVHLNRHSYITIDDFSESGRPYAQWLFGHLSANSIEVDVVYMSDYITNKYIALTGYQVTGFINEFAPAYAMGPEGIANSLNRFEALLQTRLKEVQLLKSDLRAKFGDRLTIENSRMDAA